MLESDIYVDNQISQHLKKKEWGTPVKREYGTPVEAIDVSSTSLPSVFLANAGQELNGRVSQNSSAPRLKNNKRRVNRRKQRAGKQVISNQALEGVQVNDENKLKLNSNAQDGSSQKDYDATPVEFTDVSSVGSIPPVCSSRANEEFKSRVWYNNTYGKRANRKKLYDGKQVVGNQVFHEGETSDVQNDGLVQDLTEAVESIKFSLNEAGCCRNVKSDKLPGKQKVREKNSIITTHLTTDMISGTNSKFSSKSKTQNISKQQNIVTKKGNKHTKKKYKNDEQKFINNKNLQDNKKGASTRKHRIDEVVHFEEYLSEEEVNRGLRIGELYLDNLRINPKNYRLGYIGNPDKTELDFVIETVRERNRALDGDLVVVKLKEEKVWPSPTRKSAKIVFIKQHIHPRVAIGNLKSMPDKDKSHVIFIPRDKRIPHIKIPFDDPLIPPLFFESGKPENTLFLVKLCSWTNTKFAYGQLIQNVGMSSDIEVQTKCILLENSLNFKSYGDDVKQYYPKTCEILPEEFEYRLDLRKECIFTIDPQNSRDLDDAVSCKELPNGNFEVGVHIADVTYYLKEDTPLNDIVSDKATTIYMVDSVYHMLPTDLCLMCSLLPGEDKLAFSVLWEMTKEGKIISHKFARTIMNSCAQFSYEHAQMMLENPEREFTKDELPVIYNGYTSKDISKAINNINNLALILRARRFSEGALSLNQPKVIFSLDPVTRLPESFSIYESTESHRLIEEFMLMANITVATRLKQDYRDIAFLRRHADPKMYLLNIVKIILEKVGIHLDVSSAGGLQKTLLSYSGTDILSQARMLVINYLSTKPMSRALYICAANSKDVCQYWHYALNVPLYTHFTSPIRRYADIMVHRLLSGSLGYTEKPKWNISEVMKIANNCNKQKNNAKRAGDQNIVLYMILYIEQKQMLVEKAVVADVKEKSIDVIIFTTGMMQRLYIDKFPKEVKHEFVDDDYDCEESNLKLRTLLLKWPESEKKQIGQDGKKNYLEQVISIFTIVNVSLKKNSKEFKIDCELLRPTS